MGWWYSNSWSPDYQNYDIILNNQSNSIVQVIKLGSNMSFILLYNSSCK
jgi:hypothetical protein